MFSSIVTWFTGKVGLYIGAALAVLSVILGALGAARSAGKTAAKAEQMKATQERHNADAKIKANTDALAPDDARQRLRERWTKR